MSRGRLVGVVVSVLAVASACGGGSKTKDAQPGDAAPGDAVAVDASSAKEITSFAFLSANNPGLATDVTATISANTITAKVPFADITALKATFTTTGASVTKGGTAQVSGVTANDFSVAVTYTVTAIDSSTTDYTVNVTNGFLPKVDFSTGTDPFYFAIGDLNGDSRPDLAASGAASVLLDTTSAGSTVPSFTPKFDLATGSSSVAIADFNGDGKPDLAVVAPGSGVSVFLNTTAAASMTPSFAAKVDFATGPGAFYVGVGDLNGDGKPDLAVVEACTNSQSCTDAISVLLNTTATNATTPTFATKVDFLTAAAHGYAASCAIGDLNGDGKPDIAYSNGNANTVSVFLNTTVTDATTPSFAANVDFTTGTGTGTTVAIGDLNGDGKPDLAVTSGSTNIVSVLLNTTATAAATPSFAAKVDFTTGTTPSPVGIADFSGDGRPDLAVANIGSSTVSVFLNTTPTMSTTATFAAKVDFATGTNPFAVSSADFNADDKPDLAVANFGSSSISVFLAQ